MTTHQAPITRKPPEAAPRPAAGPPSRATRWGTWVARRRWWVLAAWAVLILGSALLYPHLLASMTSPDYSVNGSDSKQVASLIQQNFTAAGAEQDVVVFDSKTLTYGSPGYTKVVNRVLADVRRGDGVVSVLGPSDPGAQGMVSSDKSAAIASVGLSGNDRQRADYAQSLQDTVTSATAKGPVKAYLDGLSPSSNDVVAVETADVERAESIGIPVAFIVLVLAFGALVAGAVPLLLALGGLTFSFGLVSLLSGVMKFDAFTTSLMTMIGVGIGIDYSLFIISRYREELGRRGNRKDAVPTSVGLAMTTSGRTIAFSAFIVMISLFSLFAVNSPMFREIALGAVLVVACTLIAAWTLLPAMIAAFGLKINKGSLPQRFQPAEDRPGDQMKNNGWARWARFVLRHPWLALPAAAILIVLSLPAFGLKLGIDMGLAALADQPSGKAEIILTNSFTPGAMSPVQVLASHQGGGRLSTADLRTIDQLTVQAGKDPRTSTAYSVTTGMKQAGVPLTGAGLAAVEQQANANPSAKALVGQYVNVGNGSNRALITVVPKSSIDSTEATNLVNDLRDKVIPPLQKAGAPQLLVGGATAQFADLSTETLGKLPLVLGLVLTLSFLYLMVVFRSLLIPLKAVVMNLLATGAAFGLTAWVFQQGHLEGLLNFTSVGFVQVYLPIMVFALLFGLSMDYEVFLIRRMQEDWVRTGDNEEAVATGLAHTARPIAAAAAIMAAVFGCFLVADVLELKEFGLALAAAVVLDATLVRLLMVPAIMKLAGRANWWLPRWLDRALPRLRLE